MPISMIKKKIRPTCDMIDNFKEIIYNYNNYNVMKWTNLTAWDEEKTTQIIFKRLCIENYGTIRLRLRKRPVYFYNLNKFVICFSTVEGEEKEQK